MLTQTLQSLFLRWRHPTVGEKAAGGIALTISVVAGSTFNAFAKSLSTSLSAVSLLFISEALTAFFVLFSYGLFPTLKRVSHLKRKEMEWVFAMAFCGGVLGPILLF